MDPQIIGELGKLGLEGVLLTWILSTCNRRMDTIADNLKELTAAIEKQNTLLVQVAERLGRVRRES